MSEPLDAIQYTSTIIISPFSISVACLYWISLSDLSMSEPLDAIQYTSTIIISPFSISVACLYWISWNAWYPTYKRTVFYILYIYYSSHLHHSGCGLFFCASHELTLIHSALLLLLLTLRETNEQSHKLDWGWGAAAWPGPGVWPHPSAGRPPGSGG